jgi:hypothetical protein
MAPALVQALDPPSLEHMQVPVKIILGDADTAAPPSTNGLVASEDNTQCLPDPAARGGQYDFLPSRTERGRATIPICRTGVAQADTHQQAIEAAEAFFDRQLRTAH